MYDLLAFVEKLVYCESGPSNSKASYVSLLTTYLIALSHIHVSAAYRSRIYENDDTPRSEPYFARETYVPRTCDVPATFPWRIRDVSVFVWNFTFVCTAYQCVCATYV